MTLYFSSVTRWSFLSIIATDDDGLTDDKKYWKTSNKGDNINGMFVLVDYEVENK